MLTKYRSDISIYHPEPTVSHMSDQELMSNLDGVLDSLSHIGRAGTILAYRLGQILNEVRNRPSIYQEYGSFSSFIDAYITDRFGVGRATCYNAMKIAAKWPGLTSEDIAAIGTVKLILLSRIASKDSDPSGKFLEAARTMTYEKFRQWAQEKGLLSPTDDEFRTLKLPKDIYDDLISVIDSPEAQARVGSENRFDVLRAMIAEFRGTYGI